MIEITKERIQFQMSVFEGKSIVMLLIALVLKNKVIVYVCPLESAVALLCVFPYVLTSLIGHSYSHSLCQPRHELWTLYIYWL